MSACPACKLPVVAGAHYCVGCGAPFQGAPPAAKITTAAWCDLCAALTDSKELTTVPAAAIASLAQSGLGDKIALWAQMTSAEKRIAFEQLARTCSWQWRLCEKCARIVTPPKPTPPVSSPPIPAVSPQTPASHPTMATLSPTKASPGALTGIFFYVGRAFLFLGALWFLLVAFAFMATSYRQTFHAQKKYIGSDFMTFQPIYIDGAAAAPHPQNGLHVYLGLFFAALTLLMLNRTFRAASGRGPIDFLLGQPRIMVLILMVGLAAFFYAPLVATRFSVMATDHDKWSFPIIFAFVFGLLYVIKPIPAFVGLPMSTAFCAVCLGAFLIGVEYRFHPDPEEAAFAFQKQFVHATNTGNLLFGRGSDDKVHVAILEPELVRQLQRHSVSVNASGENDPQLPKRDPALMAHAHLSMPAVAALMEENFKRMASVGQVAHEFPLAGWLPLALVSLLAGIAVFARIRQGPLSDNQRAMLAGAFGLQNWYLVWWFAAGVQDAWFKDGRPQVHDLIGSSLCMLPLALIFLGVMCFKMRDRNLSPHQRGGWTTVHYLVHLGSLVGIFLVSFKTPGNPALLWLLAYLLPASMCWFWSLPRWGQLRGRLP